MAANPTIYCLENLTDYLTFERLSSDLMVLQGYKNLEPLGGFSDKGRDAIHVSYNNEISIFAYSVRDDWRAKLAEDAYKIKSHNHICDKLVYVTTAKISAGQRDEAIKSIRNEYGWELEIYSQERLRILLEVEYPTLIPKHPQIFTPALFQETKSDSAYKNKIVIIFDEHDIIFCEWLIRKLIFIGYEIRITNQSIIGISISKNFEEYIQDEAIATISILSKKSSTNPKIIQQITLATQANKNVFFINTERQISPSITGIIDTKNVLPFYTNWGAGIELLLKVLEEHNIPSKKSHDKKILTESFVDKELISNNSENLYSNTFEITSIPESILIVNTSKSIPDSVINNLKYSWAVRKINSSTFISFFSPPNRIVEDFGLANIQLEEWRDRPTILGVPNINLVSELLYKSIYRKCRELGLIKCENSRLYYFPPGLSEKNTLNFIRPDGAKSHIKSSGERKFPTPNGPVKYKYFLSPIFKISQNLHNDFTLMLNIRYRLTDEKEKAYKGTSVNSRMKHLTSSWWNLEWFNRILAVVQFLSVNEKIIIVDDQNDKQFIAINSSPINTIVPYSINENRLDSLSKDRTYIEFINEEIKND